jgi:5-methylcytosine-specific restriction endonuclease McrA
MSASVRISRKTALFLRALVDDKEKTGDWRAESQRCVDELRASLAPKPKKTLPFKSRKAVTATKKRSKRDETAEIREAVMARASNRCECGCGLQFEGDFWRSYANEAELDHMFGRGRAKQSVRNTWALARACHRRKTLNTPSAAHWLNLFIAHAEKHGYSEEAGMATRLLGKQQAEAELSRGAL